ncbi:hypothetical protein ASZ90_010462 [hydrocarbon metagenome]|uniref:Uncharacterized protein n=1 Tax=hydrocarbon metagenome TaxID=938273 RepID=A0A0W8FG04_9ZZZZ
MVLTIRSRTGVFAGNAPAENIPAPRDESAVKAPAEAE